MSKKETAERCILVITGLFFSSLGIAFTKHSGLGVSPLSSVANIMSLRFSALSMGNWLIIWNCILVLGQIVILRRNFKPVQLLQIPLSFVFGWFTDFGLFLVSFIPASFYFIRISMVFIGTAVLGFGIFLAVIADTIMLPGEAFVKTVSDVSKRNFGNIKTAFDIFCVAFSIVLSLFFFNFKIAGTREGTVITAFLTGAFVKLFVKFLKSPVEKILCKK